MATTTTNNPPIECPSCGYCLAALTRASCPECGQAFAIITPEELKRKRRWLKPFLLGAFSVPVLYLSFYLFLRVTGVYESYYSQGSWEVSLDSNSQVVDAFYLPMIYFESEIQFHLAWFHDEPTGC